MSKTIPSSTVDKVNGTPIHDAPKPIHMKRSEGRMWSGVEHLLLLSILSEGANTSYGVCQKMWWSGIEFFQVRTVSEVLKTMMRHGLVTAEWDGDAVEDHLVKRADRKYGLTPVGWGYLHALERKWEEVIQKTFLITRKRVFVKT